MLDATLAARQAAAAGTRASRRPRRDGVTEAWIEFETAVGRGQGHLRLRDGKAWTLLTTLYELKGHEEPKGPGRPTGVEHGADPDRLTWLEQRQKEAAELGLRDAALRRDRRRRPGRDRARRAAAPARRADDHRRAQRAPRRLLAQALQVAVPARPGLVRPPAVPHVPRELAGVLAEGQDRRLARDVHEGHGAQLLGLTRRSSAPPTTRRRGSGRWSSSATAPRSRCGRSSSCSPPACRRKPNLPAIPGMDDFQGEQHHSSQHPGPDAYAGKKAVVIGSNNSAHDICAALWEAGADVTMVQRSSTHIVRSDTLMDIGLGALYSEQAVATGHHDREGGPDLRLAARTGSCTSSRSRCTTRCASATSDFYDAARGGRLPARLGRGRLRAVHEVPAPRLGLLHRRRRVRAGRRRATSSSRAASSRGSPSTRS